MSLTALINRACTISTPTESAEVDEYNNEVPGADVVETVCELQQLARSETTDREDISRTRWLLVLPAGTVLHADSTVTVDGDDYAVDGEPWDARNPRTQAVSHVEATLVRTSAPGDRSGS